MTSQPSPSTLRPCPWPRCPKPIRRAYLMCREHWYTLPADIRARINETYRPGQNALTASPAYRAALRDALDYARQHANPGPADDDPAPAGPFDTERQARTAAHAAVPPDAGSSILGAAENRQLLSRALEQAGVRMGRYDDRIAEWLTQWEDATVAVIAGWVQRAATRPGPIDQAADVGDVDPDDWDDEWDDADSNAYQDRLEAGTPDPEPGS